MSEVANKLRKAALGWKGGANFALDNARQLFDCVDGSHVTLLRTIADEIEAEQGECKEVEGVTESFNVPRDCEFVPVHPFLTLCSNKQQACKVLEEAAEVFGAWQKYDGELCSTYWLEPLADEIADVIQAACNLAHRYGIDVAAAMQRCEARNRERGRYD